MIHREKIPLELLNYLDNHSDLDLSRFEIPPPVFMAMKGEILSFDLEQRIFCCTFPVLKDHLNPYGVMQGGMISAAIDNTIGPLSMLVAPPNITRKMEVKYYEAIGASNHSIQVTAKFIEKKKRLLYFEADVENVEKTTKFASATATHWVI